MKLHWHWRNLGEPFTLDGAYSFGFLLAFVRRFQACEWMIENSDGHMLACSKGWKE